MKSFRTELEQPIVEQDVLYLEKRIRKFREGKDDPDKFKSLRLARGIYGQRQPGVQMIRIKLPYGRVTSEKLLRVAEVSDEYSTGRLHITTRQDVQIHHVSLDRTPELWAQLAKDDITIREACGNTVRNVTASPTAGFDQNEPFDVTPYADATFRYFLRSPTNQEMGRKFKITFSSSDEDTALTYIHDIGFLPKIKDGKRGFKVVLGGGLGSQPRSAEPLYDFFPADEIITLIEGVIRAFDRYGERSKRMKARMKFLIKDIGLEAFMKLVEEQRKAIPNEKITFDIDFFEKEPEFTSTKIPQVTIKDQQAFEAWKKTNLVPQKQEGLVAIGVRVPLGDFYTDQARRIAFLIKEYAANELRFTLRQDILIRHVREELVPFFYAELEKLGLAYAGYNRTVDVTACPGTDTCNLGISSSTGIAVKLEDILIKEYPQYVNGKDIAIKISGCMNACGQHNMAEIGLQGMSLKVGKSVAPALQILLGGGVLGNGVGRFAEKVVKVPSSRGPQALRVLLDDFEAEGNPNERYTLYYERKGKIYFYELLKGLTDTTNLTDIDFIDWGHEKPFVKAIGVGECAGVVIDLVQTLFLESDEKLGFAQEALERKQWSDTIYLGYQSNINAAKALLIVKNKKTNTQKGIVDQFDEIFVQEGQIDLPGSFQDFIYEIDRKEPSEAFAIDYLNQARLFLKKVEAHRAKEVEYV